MPRACRPYRAKTKGKVKGLFHYVRAEFFALRYFALEDMNRPLRVWLDQMANARTHGTTERVVAEHFAQESASLQRLPALRFDAVLSVLRRVGRFRGAAVVRSCWWRAAAFGCSRLSAAEFDRRQPVSC